MLNSSKRAAGLTSSISQSNTRPERVVLKDAFDEALATWDSLNLRRSIPFRDTKKEWHFRDELFLLNAKGDRALISLHHDYQNEKNIRYQRIEVYAAEYAEETGSWIFFKHGIPGYLLEGYTPEKAIDFVKRKFIEDGIANHQGQVKDDYITERWFYPERWENYKRSLKDKKKEG